MTIGGKILAVSVASVTICTIVALAIQQATIKSQSIDLTRDTMRAAIISAESMRDSMSAMRTHGDFNTDALVAQARGAADIRQTELYSTIPVVAAWKSIEKVAAREGFEFRVPKQHPRDPRNEPTAIEAGILQELETSKEEEYFKADHANNLIIYARPIKLTADCLTCHGDPVNSPTHDGKDMIGFPMENWHEGEIHGAFVLTAHLDQVDHVASAAAQSKAIRTSLLWMIPTGVLIVMGSVWYGRKGIVKPLLQLVDTIQHSCTETLEASRQIAATSQSLADSATAQSDSLQHITDSLASVSEKTRTSASGSQQARSLADDTGAAAARATEHMDRMDKAMADIRVATQSVSTVVKTIDEVAFQTNILALNAAVEAARAGDAGAGFAVVADEVRSLAQRSAQSAHQTATLVGEAQQRTAAGVQICKDVVLRLQEIEAAGSPLSRAMTAITSAAQDQQSSVHSVTSSVETLNQTTQHVAASAQESAAAAAELNAQSESLMRAVDELNVLVGSAS